MEKALRIDNNLRKLVLIYNEYKENGDRHELRLYRCPDVVCNVPVFAVYPSKLIIGFLILPDGKNFSSELLHDIESLLIFIEKPKGNLMNTRIRGISRPGMKIICKGGVWPGKRTYVDKKTKK